MLDALQKEIASRAVGGRKGAIKAVGGDRGPYRGHPRQLGAYWGLWPQGTFSLNIRRFHPFFQQIQKFTFILLNLSF